MTDNGSRLGRLQRKLAEKHLDGLLVTQNVDLFYLTGSMQNGLLFVPAEGVPVYYVRKSIVRAQRESHSTVTVEELGSMRTFGERLRQRFPCIFTQSVATADGCDKSAPVLGTEFDVLPVQAFHRLEQAVPGVRWTDGSMLIRETRMLKEPQEIDRIREAARVVDLALERAAADICLGMREYELLGIIESVLRRNGHLGLMRMRAYNQEIVTGMVGAGAAAALPTFFDGPAGGEGLSPANPQSSGRRPIGRNEPILVDIGCCIDGYVIDQTRTLVIGELDNELQRAYVASEAILREMEAMLRPGTPSEAIYVHALELAREAGLAAHFMGYGVDQVKFIGHGIGLEVDELPVLAKGFVQPLQPGMVIAVEPKFTFPGQGVVGIENSYLITDTGCEKLTVSREGIIRVG